MRKLNMMNKVLAGALATVLAATVLIGCGDSATDSAGSETLTGKDASDESAAVGEAKYGGTLRFCYNNNYATPGYTPKASANSALPYISLAYENLFTYDDAGEIVPKLAEEWSVDTEEPSITWTLREGVTFADGTPFNAEAVKVNIEEYQANNRTETANIASCEVIDDTHIKMVMSEFNSSTLEAVGFFVYYMSPTALQNDLDGLNKDKTCGTGPFQLTEFVNDAYAYYDKNENYWQEGLPYLDRVEITKVADETTAMTAFQAGEYDMLWVSQAATRQQLDATGMYTKESNKNGMGVGYVGVIPNSAADTPWANELVRRAMCYAIDFDAINAAFHFGAAIATDQWATTDSVTYNDDLNHYTYDPEKAKALLAEAGYPNGFDTEFQTISTTQDMVTGIANMLEAVGIRCKIKTIDQATANEFMSNGQWNGLFLHYTTVSPDLGLYMGRHLDKDGAFYAKGIQHPDKEMQLLADIRACKDRDEKIKLEHELQKAIYDAEEGSCIFGRPLYLNISTNYKYNYVIDDKTCSPYDTGWDLSGCWLNK